MSNGHAANMINVTVLATRHEDDGVDFHCAWQDNSGHWYSGPIVLPKGSGTHEVAFELDDKTNLGLKFMGKGDEAIWVNADRCPKSAHGNNDKGQIKDRNVASDRRLTLQNLNDDACVLHYALRFTGRPWTSPNGKQHHPPYMKDPELGSAVGSEAGAHQRGRTERGESGPRHPPKVPFVLSVGITGHRQDALPPDALPHVRDKLVASPHRRARDGQQRTCVRARHLFT